MAKQILEAARAAKQRLSRQYLQPRKEAAEFRPFSVSPDPRHNVMGVGIGPKMRDGKPTGDLSVHVYVEYKIERAALPKDMLLPTQVESVPVDVIESGRFASQLIPIQRQRLRPARPGCSVGFESAGGRVNAGTFGAVVELRGEEYILSNNHVLADTNTLPLGTDIYQPGSFDSIDGEPIARLAKFIPLTNSGPNQVDCAIAKIIASGLVDPVFLPKVDRLLSANAVEPTLGATVEKVGRTTGHTTGEIFDIDADVMIDLPRIGPARFENQLLVRGNGGGVFSAKGDSGSVIVVQRTKQATGLLCAGSSLYTVANRMSAVLEALGVTLIV